MTARIDPVYPFPTDLRPNGAPEFDRLTEALGRARAISNRASLRHCADPSPLSLAVARAAVRLVLVAQARWVRYAFDFDGSYNRNDRYLP